jgi:hypothetical protein
LVITVFRQVVQSWPLVIAVFRTYAQVIAVFRANAQFLGLDLSVPSVCGGFLGVSSDESDLRADDHYLPHDHAVNAPVIAVFRTFTQSPHR